MNVDKMYKVGIVGGILTAICCFTPVLVLLLSAIGLAALIAYLDFILLPTLAFFIILLGYASWKRKQKSTT